MIPAHFALAPAILCDMILLAIALGIAAAWATSGTALFPIGIAVAVISFWANGVLANFKGEFVGPPKIAQLGAIVGLGLSVVFIPVGLAIK